MCAFPSTHTRRFFARSFIAAIVFSRLISASGQTVHLTPLASFGPNNDGTLRPGDVSFLTSDGSRWQRGMAYNPVTGHLIVVNRFDQSVNVVDAATGALISSMDTSAIITGGNASFLINMVGVADDGAIYVGNLSNGTTAGNPAYRLYRWADESSPQQLVFAGDPGNGNANTANWRWGDTIAVRGAGLNTQVLIASRGTLAAILYPTDATFAAFVPVTLASDAASGSLGYGIAFGTGDTFYATQGGVSGGPLLRLSFNTGNGTNGTATKVQTYNSSVFPGAVSALGILPASNLLAGVDMIAGPDLVRLYDISNPANPPVLLDRGSFSTDAANSINAGAIAFGTNGVLYALDSDNGMAAFTLTSSSAPISPSVFLQPVSRTIQIGGSVTFTAAADGTAPLGYQWRFNGSDIPGATATSFTTNNVQFGSSGDYTIVVTNNVGSATSSVAVLTVTGDEVGDLLAFEPFNYDPASNLNGQGGWAPGSGTAPTIEAGNLDVFGLMPSSGNRIVFPNSSMSTRLTIPTVTNTLYFSFALKVETLGNSFTAVGTLAGLSTGPTSSGYVSKLDIRTNGGGGFLLGISKTSGTGVTAVENFNVGDTIFIVGRYRVVSGSGNDVSDIWINPSPANFGAGLPPSSPTLTVSSGTDQTPDRFVFRVGGGTSSPTRMLADELRIGTSWAQVTTPLPPTLAVAQAGPNIVLSWPTNHTAGFVVESVNDITTTDWTSNSAPVVVNGTNNTVTLPAAGSKTFFRLHKSL